jgi:hypothetical protein
VTSTVTDKAITGLGGAAGKAQVGSNGKVASNPAPEVTITSAPIETVNAKPEAKPAFASAEVSIEQRRAEYVALDSNDGATAASVGEIFADLFVDLLCGPRPENAAAGGADGLEAGAGRLDATIGRDWHEAELALEALTRHTPAAAAKVIPASKVSLITEIVDWLVDLKLEFTVRSAGDGEAPAADPPAASPHDGDAGGIPDYLRRDVS